MTITEPTAHTGSWGTALAELGLDHPALMRLGSTRDLLERAHRVHEQRRALQVRLVETRAALDKLELEFDTVTGEGLTLLDAVREEVASYTSDLSGISERLRDRLDTVDVGEVETLSDDSFASHHGLADQYEEILDMFSSFGMFDARSRTVRFQGAKGRVHHVPTFETLMSTMLTEELRNYLAGARELSLILTPAADQRVFAAVGKTVAFSNYAGIGGGSGSDAEACSDFVRRLRVADSSNVLTDDLVRSSPFDGLKVSFYAHYASDSAGQELFAQGQPLDATADDITIQRDDAAEVGVDARPLTPPEYLMLQAVRRRHGQPLLDTGNGHAKSETWFPEQTLYGAQGTLVARSVQRSLRFRSVELGKGVEGRGYRMSYAPLAA